MHSVGSHPTSSKWSFCLLVFAEDSSGSCLTARISILLMSRNIWINNFQAKLKLPKLMLVVRQWEELKNTILILLIKAAYGSWVVDHLYSFFSPWVGSHARSVNLSKQGCNTREDPEQTNWTTAPVIFVEAGFVCRLPPAIQLVSLLLSTRPVRPRIQRMSVKFICWWLNIILSR